MIWFSEIPGLLAVVLAAALVGWLASGGLLLPVPCPVRTEVLASGGGEGLEMTVKGLLRLRRAGLWRGTVVIRDCGLSCGGRALAVLLARQDGVELI